MRISHFSSAACNSNSAEILMGGWTPWPNLEMLSLDLLGNCLYVLAKIGLDTSLRKSRV